MKACFNLADEAATNDLAKKLASCLTAPLFLSFQGDLGAGKTTLIRGILRELGVTGAIKSPTFSLLESYFFSDYVIHHFDLYRLSDANNTSLDALGFRDHFASDAIFCIEWAARAPSLNPYIDVVFLLEVKGEGRMLSVTAKRAAGEALVSHLRRTVK